MYQERHSGECVSYLWFLKCWHIICSATTLYVAYNIYICIITYVGIHIVSLSYCVTGLISLFLFGSHSIGVALSLKYSLYHVDEYIKLLTYQLTYLLTCLITNDSFNDILVILEKLVSEFEWTLSNQVCGQLLRASEAKFVVETDEACCTNSIKVESWTFRVKTRRSRPRSWYTTT